MLGEKKKFFNNKILRAEGTMGGTTFYIACYIVYRKKHSCLLFWGLFSCASSVCEMKQIDRSFV